MNWKPMAAAAVVLRKSCLFMMKAGWWVFYLRKIPILQVRDILQSSAGRYSYFKIWKRRTNHALAMKQRGRSRRSGDNGCHRSIPLPAI
jgi:hypothetical protein